MVTEDDTTRASVAARLDKMLAAEGVERQRAAAMWVSASMAAIAPLILFLTGYPGALYYHALILLFVVIAWVQYFCVRENPGKKWIDYVFVALNFSLLSFTLLSPNPLSDIAGYAFTPSLSLRWGNILFFFLILCSLAFSFSPWLLLWGGACAAVSWSLGRLWVISQPGIELFDPDVHVPADASLARSIEIAQNPRFVDAGVWIQEVVVVLIIASLLALVVQGSRQLLLRRAIEERRGANLARYLPGQLAARMAETDAAFVEDRDADAAVLFTDLVGFTRWAEAHKPHETVALLRDCHGFVVEEVFRAGGVLDKFIGDGAMATFGTTGHDSHPAERALSCVEAIVTRAAAYNAAREAAGSRAVPLSVGAHFGRVTIGDVGTGGRLEMAVLGDAVNVASRLEEMTRPLDVAAVVSDQLMAKAGGPRPGWRCNGEQVLHGRAGGIIIWTLARARTATEHPAQSETAN